MAQNRYSRRAMLIVGPMSGKKGQFGAAIDNTGRETRHRVSDQGFSSEEEHLLFKIVLPGMSAHAAYLAQTQHLPGSVGGHTANNADRQAIALRVEQFNDLLQKQI